MVATRRHQGTASGGELARQNGTAGGTFCALTGKLGRGHAVVHPQIRSGSRRGLAHSHGRGPGSAGQSLSHIGARSWIVERAHWSVLAD